MNLSENPIETLDPCSRKINIYAIFIINFRRFLCSTQSPSNQGESPSPVQPGAAGWLGLGEGSSVSSDPFLSSLELRHSLKEYFPQANI